MGDCALMQARGATISTVMASATSAAPITVLALLALQGCASKPPPPPAPPPPPPPVLEIPGWVFENPKPSGQICATGAVDPTFYRQDGRVNAAEAARNELARSIQVHISSVMYDSATNRGGSVRQYIVSEVVTAVNEGVLSGAEIVSYWYDETGAVSRKGMTYALACMDTNQSVADLAAKLEEAYPDEEHKDQIAAVKERARAAFDELEAMEDKRAAKGAAPTPNSGGANGAPTANP